MATNTFFGQDAAVGSTDWVIFDFGTEMASMTLINRGTADLIFSFNGTETAGRLPAADFQLTRDGMWEQILYVKTESGTGAVEVQAWRGEP